jgi:cytidyltransferase-like protein
MTVKIILEKKGKAIPTKQEKTAVVIIGRFQPPTLGHATLINAAKKAWRENKYDAVIVFIVEGKETSKDKKHNPLTGEQREYFLKHSTYSKGLRFAVVGSAFDAFIKCRELGFEPMCVVGGKFVEGEKEENRAEGYKKMLDKYFKDEDGEPIEHKAVVLERSQNGEGVQSISGTTVRAAVLADRYHDFAEMVATSSEKVTKKMFAELKAALTAKEKDEE